MKNLILILLILTAGFSVANAQQKQSKPDEKTIVNKEFDENGNLIKYDSLLLCGAGAATAHISLNFR